DQVDTHGELSPQDQDGLLSFPVETTRQIFSQQNVEAFRPVDITHQRRVQVQVVPARRDLEGAVFCLEHRISSVKVDYDPLLSLALRWSHSVKLGTFPLSTAADSSGVPLGTVVGPVLFRLSLSLDRLVHE
ncbi:hypothetical protein XENOCAPTIV_000785, partial [Xenoophorus captivus]